MRVIGGNARGRRLKVPKGQTLRPTAGRVKEALFNILPHDLSGTKVLDLFAGTGNVTIEALSRGAAAAILVDSSVESGKAIRENLRRLHLTDRTKVWIMPVARALRFLARHGETFDLIFLDPPYGAGWLTRSIAAVAGAGLLESSGVIVGEGHWRDRPSFPGGYVVTREARYGETALWFIRAGPHP